MLLTTHLPGLIVRGVREVQRMRSRESSPGSPSRFISITEKGISLEHAVG
jgi:hypothetical protein